jgi:O-antigen/teichoic acid export membrane protein
VEIAQATPPIVAPLTQPATEHIRGSSLLLAGKVLAQVLELSAQILLIRYLTKADYGAYSYALSIALLGKDLAMFGLGDTLARFLPLYRERRQYGTILGAIIIAVAIVASFGMLLSGGINIGLRLSPVLPTSDRQALALLALFALLIPLEALEGLLTSLLASFGGTRAIFFRKSVVAPGLKFGLLLLMMLIHKDVLFLTMGYLLISFGGVLLYAGSFLQILRGQIRAWPVPQRVTYPARELLSFAAPLLVTTVLWLLMESSDALLLGYFRDSTAVADFRAVLPFARLNQGVIITFGVLYMPLASRLYARLQRAELAELYWQTAAWMTVLTFPIFLLTCGFTRATTTDLLGAQYGDAASILALLSGGYFFHTALGFNGLTLKLHGWLRYTLAIDLTAATLNIAVNLLLIPHWGALGAAMGTAGTMVFHNVLKQVGLWRYTRIAFFERRFLPLYGATLILTLVAALIQRVFPVTLWTAVPMVLGASAALFWGSRGVLQVSAMFPEVGRLPLFRAFWK